jgi:hypothetical protein
MEQLIQPPPGHILNEDHLKRQLMQKPAEKDLPAEKPPKQENGPDEWPEDDVAEKYIKDGGKKETPTKEEDDERDRTLKESEQPKK